VRRVRRALTWALVAAVAACGLTGVEAWPLTGWRLFSQRRGPVAVRLEARVVEPGGAEAPIPFHLGLRLALSPFAAAVGQPDALWRPRGTGLVFSSPPPAGLVVAVQVAGVAGAALFLWRRRLAPLVGAWVCLLVLAGVRTRLGKILHNDVLLVLASVPLLLAGSHPTTTTPAPGSLAPLFVLAAAAMHVGTWLVLGLDYFAHLATAALVLLPWARMRRMNDHGAAPTRTAGTGPAR